MKIILLSLVVCSFVLAGCVQEKPSYPNPGYDEIDSYLLSKGLKAPVNETVEASSDPLPNNETQQSEEVVDEKHWYSRFTENGVVKAVYSLLDKVVKGLFGEKGWYYIGAAIVLIIAFMFFKTVGVVIAFLLLMFIFTQVIGK